MAAVFLLASARAVLQETGKQEKFPAALFFFLLAVYSKESAVPFALFVYFIYLGIHKLTWVESAKRAGAFLAVALLYMVHRHLVIGRSTQAAPLSGSYGQTLIDMFPVLVKYLRLLCGIPAFW